MIYLNKDRKEDFIKNNQLRFLRPYQINAIKNLIKDFKKGKSKFLFTMATGTGKTLLSAAICKLFLRNSIAKRLRKRIDKQVKPKCPSLLSHGKLSLDIKWPNPNPINTKSKWKPTWKI